MNHDTIKLLRECNAGIKMGTNAFKKVLPRVKNHGLKSYIENSNSIHCELGDRTHGMLTELGADTKPPHALVSAMSDVKISLQLMMNESDKQVASLMTDGCNMGVKSLYKYLNQYEAADKEAKKLCRKLIDIEEKLCDELKEYL